MRKLLKSVLLIVLFLAVDPAKAQNLSAKDLTLDEKVGQLLFVGFQGESLDQMTASHFQKIRPGAYILFGRNITSGLQVHSLNRSLQKLSKDFSGIPALIALDQEGGVVARVQTDPPLPSPRAIGKTKNPELAKSFGKEIGVILRSLGFNMNLAPVLDVSSATSWDFIGNRSFGTSVNNVSFSGRAFAEGLLSAGVLPTAKHFPGSGGLKSDPHFSSPESPVTKEQLLREQMVPFKNYSELFPSALMLSHVRYPNIDSKNVPASFSKVIASDLVRGNMNYHGLVVTDDLLMDGAKLFGKPGRAAVEAVKAGADLVMVSWSRKDQIDVFESLKSAVRNKEISLTTLNAKVDRILRTKKVLASQKIESYQRLPKLQNSRLAALEMDLLLENLEQDLKGKSLKSNFVQSKNTKRPLYIFSQDIQFHEQIRRSLNQPIAVFKTLKSLEMALQKNPQAFAVVLTNSRALSIGLDRFSKRLKSQILSVSSVSPGPHKDAAFWGQVYTYFMHPKLGWEVGMALTADSKRLSKNE